MWVMTLFVQVLVSHPAPLWVLIGSFMWVLTLYYIGTDLVLHVGEVEVCEAALEVLRGVELVVLGVEVLDQVSVAWNNNGGQWGSV